MRALEFTKKKLVLQEWRQSLKTKSVWSCLQEADVIRESEEPSEAEVHQSLKTGSWSLLKVVILNEYDCRRNGSLEQRLFQRNLKALVAYPLKSAGQRTWYNCTTTTSSTPLLMSAVVQDNNCCNALSNYIIILLDDMVYVYILYGFWWFCDVFVTCHYFIV